MNDSYRSSRSRCLVCVVCLATALALSGCPSFRTLQTARTVGAGNTQFAVEPTLEGIQWMGTLYLPGINFSARHGVNETLDVGGSFGTSGIGVMGKQRLSSPDSSLIMSIGPNVSGLVLGSGSFGIINLELPFLLGIPVGETDSEIVITPKLLHNIMFLRGESDDGDGRIATHLTLVGGSLAFAGKLGRSLWIVPEVAAGIPLFATAGASLTVDDDESALSASTLFPGGVLLTFGLGFLFEGF